jgi:hypothetical protein
MSVWEIGTWLASIVLGPGALLVFFLFLRDARKIVQRLEEDRESRNSKSEIRNKFK